MRKKINKLLILLIFISPVLYSQNNKQPMPQLRNDAYPNPKSPEGIERLRNITQNKLISIDSLNRSIVDKLMQNFFYFVEINDTIRFEELLLDIDKDRKESNIIIFKKMHHDLKKFNINLSDYKYGITEFNQDKNTLTILINNKDGISTGKIRLIIDDGEKCKIQHIIP